jgi:thiol-disulfide isomerase/thioredoxin
VGGLYTCEGERSRRERGKSQRLQRPRPGRGRRHGRLRHPACRVGALQIKIISWRCEQARRTVDWVPNSGSYLLMSKLSKYRVLIAGILSPVAAIFLYAVVSQMLGRASADLEKDWLFRLSLATLAMTLPFLGTLVLAIKDRRRQALFLSGKIGLALATLSLGLVLSPVSDGITRLKQSRNQAMRDVAAPPFETVDIFGNSQRLGDHKGEVVLVNIWATWCAPCRNEMPKLDRLYRERKDKGLIVFGFSDEDVNLQQKYVKEVPVSYPLLTLRGQVPNLYRDIARYPAIFLIDRQGRLQPAPSPDQPFEKVEAAVDALLNSGA